MKTARDVQTPQMGKKKKKKKKNEKEEEKEPAGDVYEKLPKEK